MTASLESLLELEPRKSSEHFRIFFQLQQSPLLSAETPRSILKKTQDHSPLSHKVVCWSSANSRPEQRPPLRHRVSFPNIPCEKDPPPQQPPPPLSRAKRFLRKCRGKRAQNDQQEQTAPRTLIAPPTPPPHHHVASPPPPRDHRVPPPDPPPPSFAESNDPQPPESNPFKRLLSRRRTSRSPAASRDSALHWRVRSRLTSADRTASRQSSDALSSRRVSSPSNDVSSLKDASPSRGIRDSSPCAPSVRSGVESQRSWEKEHVWSLGACCGPMSPVSSQLTTSSCLSSAAAAPEPKPPSERIFFNSLEDLREFSPELKHKIPIGMYEFAFLDAHFPEDPRDKKWELVGVKGSTRMYKQITTVNGSDLIMVKGYATIDVDVHTVLWNIRDTPRRTAWDTTFDGFTLVEGNIQDNEIVYNSIKAPWPVADRNFVQWRRTHIDEKTGVVKILHRSAEHPAYPEDSSSSMIRAESIISAYILTPRGREKCDVFLLTQTDIKGLIPRWMVNAASAKTPFAWIENLRKACHETQKLRRPIPPYNPKPLFLSGVPVGAS